MDGSTFASVDQSEEPLDRHVGVPASVHDDGAALLTAAPATEDVAPAQQVADVEVLAPSSPAVNATNDDVPVQEVTKEDSNEVQDVKVEADVSAAIDGTENADQPETVEALNSVAAEHDEKPDDKEIEGSESVAVEGPPETTEVAPQSTAGPVEAIVEQSETKLGADAPLKADDAITAQEESIPQIGAGEDAAQAPPVVNSQADVLMASGPAAEDIAEPQPTHEEVVDRKNDVVMQDGNVQEIGTEVPSNDENTLVEASKTDAQESAQSVVEASEGDTAEIGQTMVEPNNVGSIETAKSTEELAKPEQELAEDAGRADEEQTSVEVPAVNGVAITEEAGGEKSSEVVHVNGIAPTVENESQKTTSEAEPAPTVIDGTTENAIPTINGTIGAQEAGKTDVPSVKLDTEKADAEKTKQETKVESPAATKPSDAISAAASSEPNTLKVPAATPTPAGATPSDPVPLSVHSPATPAVDRTPPPTSGQAATQLAKQIALLLKINKELIRLCVDLQAKELTSDPIFRQSATRLQANLAFLASIADPATANHGNGTTANAVMINDEPFPDSPHTQDSLLPKLYIHLRSVSLASDGTSPSLAGKKRRRETSQDEEPSSRKSSLAVSEKDHASAATTPEKSSDAQSRGGMGDRRKSSISATPINTAAAQALLQAATSSHSTPRTSRAPSLSQQAASPLNNMSPSISTASVPRAPTPQQQQQQPQQQPQAGAAAQPNGIRPPTNGPTPQQLQSLVQAFGQNAVNNLNALQSHYRSGQQQPIVAYMEANVANFRTLPLQVQLQHMANAQNAAMQRQRQASLSSNGAGGGGASSASSPTAQQGPLTPGMQARPPPAALRRPSAAPSPGPLNGGSVDASLQRRTQSPMAAPATPFQGQNAPSAQTPGTPAGGMQMPFGNVAASPAASVASPGANAFGQQNHMMQQQQQQQQPFGFPSASQAPQMQPGGASQAQQFMASLPSSLAGMPAHLQQQLYQHFMQQQQQQQQHAAQQLLTSQPMAPPMGNAAMASNPMMAAFLQQQQAGNPHSPSAFRPPMTPGNANAAAGGMPNLANLWASVQQQQQNQPQPPSNPNGQ